MMKKLCFLGTFLILALTACSGEGELAVTNLRANLALPSETGAVYLTIANGTSRDETLLGASIPGCTTIELHEMTMEDGVMRMNQVEGGVITISAGETVEFKQGGLHVMCIGKTGGIEVGDTVPVTLSFENAGTMTFDAAVISPGE